MSQRRKMTSKGSKRLFSATGGRTQSANFISGNPMRGGIRL